MIQNNHTTDGPTLVRPRLDDEFRDLLPPLTADELKGLTDSICTDGCRDPLVYWEEEGILVDGYNRFAICLERNIPYTLRAKKFPSRNHVIDWMVTNQLSRRNLTDQQRTYLVGKEYLARVHKQALESEGTDRPDNVAEELGKKHNVTERTIRRAGEFAGIVDAKPTEEKAKILSGKGPTIKTVVLEATGRQAQKPSKAERKLKPKPVKEKNGAVIFDWKTRDTAISLIARIGDDLRAAYKEYLPGPDEQAVNRQARELHELLTVIKQRVMKAQKGK